jgi:NADH-quinone oxidoreductase subunit E
MFRLSSEGEAFVKKQLSRFEDRKSAIIPSLYRVQIENGGWVSPECVTALAAVMDIQETWIEEVLTFYTMFNRKPVGKVHAQVCCNVACAMNGGRELLKHLCDTFKATPEEMTADGKYTFSRAECLGACDKAPMMQVTLGGDMPNSKYHEGLTQESAVKIISGLAK